MVAGRKVGEAAQRKYADSIIAGTNTASNVSKETHVTPQAVRAWVRKRKEELSHGAVPQRDVSTVHGTAKPVPSVPQVPAGAGSDASRVEAARKAGGIGMPATGGADGRAAGSGGGTDPFAGKTPDQIKSELLSACEGVNFIVLKASAAFTRSPVDVEQLAKLTKSEREFLGQFAISAAPYVDMILRHADKIGAGIFFVGYGLSTFGKLGTVRKEAAKMKKAEAEAKARADAENAKPAASTKTAGSL